MFRAEGIRIIRHPSRRLGPTPSPEPSDESAPTGSSSSTVASFNASVEFVTHYNEHRPHRALAQ